MGTKKRPLSERFWARVERGMGCWEWRGYRNSLGYGGTVDDLGKTRPAHRASWELTFGPIPPGLFVCHRCDNPGCVNPGHLFLGTQRDNIQDASRKGRVSRGEHRHCARLSEVSVALIRRRHAEGETQNRLAAEFGVTRQAIWHVVHRKSWKHIA